MRRITKIGLDVLAYAFFAALCVLTIRITTPHAQAHDGDAKWMQPHLPALICCNNQDCEPAAARHGETRKGCQALIERRWIDSPAHIILDQSKTESASFYGGHHA